jgi:guanosine-3',5'-bis(diphosphate) 3'-pyrophosphohydrolase
MRFAAAAHHGQVRKGGIDPYLLHPVAVVQLLASSGASEDVLCAGYLHDAVEDTEVTIEEVAAVFGLRVAGLVAAVTEDKQLRWRERKQAAIDALETAEDDVLLLKGADLAVNITDVVLDYREIGDQVWERFRGSPPEQVWYYGSAADIVLRRLTGYGLMRTLLRERISELRALVDDQPGVS